MSRYTHSAPSDRGQGHQPEEVLERLQAAAAHFYSLRPPLILESLRCLHAVMSLSPPQRTQARTLLQVSHLLHRYCDNYEKVCTYLEQCRLLCQSLGSMDQVKFPCLHLLAKVYLSSGHTQRAKQVLKAALDESEDKPFWHATFLFQLSELYHSTRDMFHSTLSRGVKYCEKNDAPIPLLYFMLMQLLHLETDFRYKEATALSQDLFSRLDKLQHPSCVLLKASHHTIFLLSGLQLGNILTCKAQLKELQMFAREISHSNASEITTHPDQPPSIDNFVWIQRDNLFQLVYLISMMHPMLSGATDKAVGYADKALGLISQQTQLLQAQPWEGLSGENVSQRLADHFQTLVLHNLCVCKIVKGSLSEVPSLLQKIESLKIRPVDTQAYHFLVGLYLFAQDRYKLALSHFQFAIDTPKTGTHPQDVFLHVLTLIHISICYVKLGPHYYDSDVMSQLMGRLRAVRNHHLPHESLHLNAAANFVVGLHQALLQSLPEAKSALKEAVVLANTEDLHKLVSCTLILLGKVFMAIGKKEEAGSMIPPAYQLACKIQDSDLQIWASTLMAEFCQSVGDEALYRETMATQKQKLSRRDLELKEVLSREDGSISMPGWSCEDERVGQGMKSPCSPEAKRLRMGNPFSPRMDNEEDSQPLRPDIDKENKEMSVGRQEVRPHKDRHLHSTSHSQRYLMVKDEPQDNMTNHIVLNTGVNHWVADNTPNHMVQDNMANHEHTRHHNRGQRENETLVRPQFKKTPVSSQIYSSASEQDPSSELNGSYHEPIHQMPDAKSHTLPLTTNTPLNMSSESPLKHSACQPHPVNGMQQQQQDSRNSTPQSTSGASDSAYQMQARRGSDLSYHPQPSPVYPQISAQHYSPRPAPQPHGVRLLSQGEWRGDTYEAPLTPQYPAGSTEAQSCQYQHILQQQLARQLALSQGEVTDVGQSQQLQMEQMSSSYPGRSAVMDVSCQKLPTPPRHNSMEHIHRQIPTDQNRHGYPVMDPTQMRQAQFDLDPNLETRHPNPPRQPFLQSLLQSSPINTISPEKLIQQSAHTKRPRISPDPLTLPTSSHPAISRPLGVLPQGMISPLVIQNYSQSSSPSRQQHTIQYPSPQLQGFYNKNMTSSFGQYFLPRASILLPQGSYYPHSQVQAIDPSLLQMHSQHREK